MTIFQLAILIFVIESYQLHGIYIYAKPKSQREKDYNNRMREKAGDSSQDRRTDVPRL